MKVYVLVSGSDWDYTIRGVFSSPEALAAARAANDYPGPLNEETFEIDVTDSTASPIERDEEVRRNKE